MGLPVDMGGNILYVEMVVEGYKNPQQTPSGVVSMNLSAGSSKTLTGLDSGKTVLLDTATGSTVILPASSGSGRKFKFIVTTLATTNSHVVKVANSTDTMQGIIVFADTDGTAAVNAFAATATQDTITLNRSTSGSVSLGEWFEVEDYTSGKWHVRGSLSNTGAPATPFSASV
jgi:hypothetical protein